MQLVSGEPLALFHPFRPRVVVSMRDHALRRIVSSVIRGDGGHDVVEAFDEHELFAELARSTVESVVLDARRDPIGALDTLSSLREKSRMPVVLVVTKLDESFVGAASRLGASLLRIPVTSNALKAAVTRVTRD